MKHRTTFSLILVSLLLTAVACGHIAKPEGWAAPVSDGDRIFAQIERGTISGGSLSSSGTFSEDWRYPAETDDLDFDGFYATPIVDGDTLYIASYDGNVVALDTGSGRPLWPAVVELDANIVATPLLDGTSLFVPASTGELIVLDAENGVEKDRLLEHDGRIWSAPASRGGTLYVGNLDARELWAVTAATDEIEWNSDAGGGLSADLVLVGDLVLAGSLDRALRAFDSTSNGAERWKYDTRGWVVAAPLVSGDVVYGATLRGEVFALEATSGDERWAFVEEGLEFRARPILVDGVLVVADRDGRIRGLDPATGELRWETDLEGVDLFADPLLFDGKILYLTKDGELLSITANNGSSSTVFGRGG